MVAEMVAILLWQLSDATVNSQSMTIEREKALFGRSFESLGQEQRVRLLVAFDLLSPEAETLFNEIRTIRRKYLHLWSQDHDRLEEDAVTCFHAAVGLVIAAIGQDVRNGTIVLNPRLIRYLERQGLYEPPEESSRQ